MLLLRADNRRDQGAVLANEANPRLADALDALLSLAAERAPTAAHCLGRASLTDYLVSQLMAVSHFHAGDIDGGARAGRHDGAAAVRAPRRQPGGPGG